MYASSAYSLDTTAAKYYPLKTGNVYTYMDISGPPNDTSYHQIRFTKDSVFNGHKYYALLENPGNDLSWRRIDSATTNLMEYDAANTCPYYGHEILVDSLNIRIGNYEGGNCPGGTPSIRCDDTSHIIFFNYHTQVKGYYLFMVPSSSSWDYAKNIGYYGSIYVYHMWGHITTLKGCIVNGVLYGDTSMPVGVAQSGTDLPTEFTLDQNYPNPFNPTTFIKYYLPKQNYIKISVYDLNGKLISTLADNEQSEGTHYAIFDGTPYSSGVYFYVFECYDFTRKLLFSGSRKMLMIK